MQPARLHPLPKVKDGVDARVIMPLYGDLKYRDKLEYVTNYSVPVGWRSQYCGLFKADVDGVTYYFLDNEYYFKRRGLYGFYDDGERFAFFSRAVLETLFYTDFTPDIINCNDWQTALVPVYLNLYYRHLDKFNRIKTVFTIHNIAYQGKYGTDILEDTCGIGHRDHIRGVRRLRQLHEGRLRDRRQDHHRQPHLRTGDPGPVVQLRSGRLCCAKSSISCAAS